MKKTPDRSLGDKVSSVSDKAARRLNTRSIRGADDHALIASAAMIPRLGPDLVGADQGAKR